MASNELKEKLNDAIAREMQVSIQYMWQHVTVPGKHAWSAGGIFKKFAITEMKHAEEIAERLNNLGGAPTTKPTPITVGKTVKDMLEINVKAEEGAIALYREIIRMAEKEDDIVTRKLFESILVDEEEHYYVFMDLLIYGSPPGMIATICEQVIEEQWSHVSFERETRLISLVLGR